MQNFKDKHKADYILTQSDAFAKIANAIETEIGKAEAKHPEFVDTFADALLVINEELGEASRAYLLYQYEGGGYEEVRKELVQVGATVFRMLLNLDEYVADNELEKLGSAFPYNLQGETYIALQKGTELPEAVRDGIEKFIDILEGGHLIKAPKFALGTNKPLTFEGLLKKMADPSLNTPEKRIASMLGCPGSFEIEVKGYNGFIKTSIDNAIKHYAEFTVRNGTNLTYPTEVSSKPSRIVFRRSYNTAQLDAADRNDLEAFAAMFAPVGYNYKRSVTSDESGYITRSVVYTKDVV